MGALSCGSEASIDSPGPDGKSAAGPQPQGILIYTEDGHMSVQLMYPGSADTPSSEYVLKGYEASFGSFEVDEAAHTVTHHVQGSITRDLLVGKDLPRKFEFTPDGHLIIRSTRPDEHRFVTWAHYQTGFCLAADATNPESSLHPVEKRGPPGRGEAFLLNRYQGSRRIGDTGQKGEGNATRSCATAGCWGPSPVALSWRANGAR
jgi:hypothetical protein